MMKLENKANMPIPEGGEGFPLQTMQFPVFKPDFALRRFIQSAQDMQ